ncbi:hypothetical protein CKO09_11765 [Chromatium weissei]|nr:hypothetical protein [Chromatium weissei]
MNQEFMKPRLVGKRFDQHSAPLEMLRDFAALEALLVEIAKREFLKTNQDRVRIPKGFTRGLELHLTAIEEGSTILVINLIFSTLLPSVNIDYFVRAKEQVIDSIASVACGQHPSLSPDLLRYFDRFGRGLHEDEKIEFTRNDGQVVVLTRAIREKLLLASQSGEWTEEVILKGCIPEVDQSNMSFELEQRTGIKLKAPLDEQHRETVLKAVNGYSKRQFVVVQGIIKRNRANQAQCFESIGYISLLDPLDVETRLEELAELSDGWLNGKGKRLEQSALKKLTQYFDDYFALDLPLPYLYPTAEGGIQAEWSQGDWEVSLEIELTEMIGHYQALNLTTNELIEQPLDLYQGEMAWDQLNTLLKSLLEGVA